MATPVRGRRGGGGYFSQTNRGTDASQARYEAQARAQAQAAAAARAVAAGRGNPQAPVAEFTAFADDGGYSDGGGGGGFGGVAAAPVITPPSLEDYIRTDYLVTQQEKDNERALQDFDSITARDQGLVQLDQQNRFKQLGQQLDEAGTNSAGDLASRGLLRSGFTAQAQDRINAEGAKQRTGINDLLTNFLSGRTTGRLDQESKNRAALAEARQNSVNNYYSRYYPGV